MNTNIVIETNSQALCQRAAAEMLMLAKKALAAGRNFNIALAGGSTPKALYQTLCQAPYINDMPWQTIHFFFGDERAVGPDHPESNYRMARENLFDQLPIKASQIHRIKGAEDDVVVAAKQYDAVLESHLSVNSQGVAQFDLVLLGLGPDGHIASLFPGTDILAETDHRAAAVWVKQMDTWRISITFPFINHARHVWLFVCGEGKANIIKEVIDDPEKDTLYPVQMIQALGEKTWYLDNAAALKLKSNKDS